MTGAATRSVMRRLIRARRFAFKGDEELLRTAQAAIRGHFQTNRDASPEKLPKMLKEAEDAIEFLRNNVVQAPLNDRGNYQVDAIRIDESRLR